MPHRSTNWFSSVQWSFDERVEIADWIIDSMCSCATFYRRLFHVDWKKKLIESRTTRADWLSFGFPAELKLKTLLQTMSSLIPANLIQFSLWFHLLSLLNSLYCNILCWWKIYLFVLGRALLSTLGTLNSFSSHSKVFPSPWDGKGIKQPTGKKMHELIWIIYFDFIKKYFCVLMLGGLCKKIGNKSGLKIKREVLRGKARRGMKTSRRNVCKVS